MKFNMQIEALFRLNANETLTFKPHAERLHPILEQLVKIDPHAENWLLQGDSLKDALLYSVFESDGTLNIAAEAVLETSQKKDEVRLIAMWNGEDDSDTGVAASYMYSKSSFVPSKFTVDLSNDGAINFIKLPLVQSLISSITEEFNPSCISVFPFNYFAQQVFKDRPGVGWMLYLPQILSAQQVPEARALIPVMHEKKQSGTIIVSVTDAPFDINNPEHIKIANAIEIRLVDQDLLPKFSDL